MTEPQQPSRNTKKAVTMEDLAKEAGVSTSTVSLVLNKKGNITEKTKGEVMKAARRLGYVHLPRQRSNSKHQLLGLIVEALPYPVTSDSFLNRVISAIERTAAKHGYHVAISLVDGESTSPDLPAFVRSRDVQGMLVVGSGDLTDEYLLELCSRGIPTVLVDNYLFDAMVPSVTIDNLRSGFQLTQHLTRLGHKRIGFVRGSRKYKPLLERLQGYQMALTYHHIEHEATLVPDRLSRGTHKGYFETLKLLDLAEPPTAIVAVSDRTAVNVLRAVHDKGLHVPNDIAVASFDDLPEAVEQSPQLTTMRIPKEELGETAVEHLLRIIEEKDVTPINIQLYSELIVRQSCGALGQREIPALK